MYYFSVSIYILDMKIIKLIMTHASSLFTSTVFLVSLYIFSIAFTICSCTLFFSNILNIFRSTILYAAFISTNRVNIFSLFLSYFSFCNNLEYTGCFRPPVPVFFFSKPVRFRGLRKNKQYNQSHFAAFNGCSCDFRN